VLVFFIGISDVPAMVGKIWGEMYPLDSGSSFVYLISGYSTFTQYFSA
jgi:hypothetical protein